MNNIAKYGSLATHRAFLGRPPKRGVIAPFRCSAKAVFERQVKGLVTRLGAIGCERVVIGISGGLDSTLALLVAVEAFDRMKLPRKQIFAIGMPGFGTSVRTKSNSTVLCGELGVTFELIPIVRTARQHLKDIGHDGVTCDITYENAQARIRTLILMDKANLVGGIVLGTGDMSEIALGWCTYNGDHMSMFGVNNGVPKTIVRKVCGWWAATRPEGACARAVRDIVDTPVSPELKKGQVTEDTIGPYELHDFFLWNFIMNEMGPGDLLIEADRYFNARGERFSLDVIRRTLAIFLRRFFTQAFKRNCQPDGIRVFPFELSLHGWWIPSCLGQPRRFRV